MREQGLVSHVLHPGLHPHTLPHTCSSLEEHLPSTNKALGLIPKHHSKYINSLIIHVYTYANIRLHNYHTQTIYTLLQSIHFHVLQPKFSSPCLRHARHEGHHLHREVHREGKIPSLLFFLFARNKVLKSHISV